jgi:hypothetical protein
MDTLIALVLAHKYLLAAPLVIGCLMRLVKDDSIVPIPSQYRVWVSLGLGIVAGVIDKFNAQGSWPVALTWGVVTAMTAIAGPETIIESMRGGREFFTAAPLPPAPPADSKTPSAKDDSAEDTEKKPAAHRDLRTRLWTPLALTTLFIWATIVLTPACKNPQTTNTIVNTVLTIEQAGCVIAQAEMGASEPAAVMSLCSIDLSLLSDVVKLFTSSKVGMAYKAQYQRSLADAGLPGSARLEGGVLEASVLNVKPADAGALDSGHADARGDAR